MFAYSFHLDSEREKFYMVYVAQSQKEAQDRVDSTYAHLREMGRNIHILSITAHTLRPAKIREYGGRGRGLTEFDGEAAFVNGWLCYSCPGRTYSARCKQVQLQPNKVMAVIYGHDHDMRKKPLTPHKREMGCYGCGITESI